MPQTILITGASSGIGKATAQFFHQRGWQVAATMRKPELETELIPDERMVLLPLDVENPESINAATVQAIATFGRIDVWVNNAGYGALGPMEAGSREQIFRQFNVNYFGLVDCIKAILPHFKQNQGGVLINISSVGGLLTVPTFTVYNSSKFAVEGLAEGLWYELAPFGIKVKLIEPGGVSTDFTGRSLDLWDISALPEYQPLMDKVASKFTDPSYTKNFAAPVEVAKVIFQAATDGSDRLRYLVGRDAKMFWGIRSWLGYRFQMGQLKKFFGL